MTRKDQTIHRRNERSSRNRILEDFFDYNRKEKESTMKIDTKNNKIEKQKKLTSKRKKVGRSHKFLSSTNCQQKGCSLRKE